MNISVFGKSESSLRLSSILQSLNTDISGVYDTDLQSAVEFAAITDSKAYLNTDEAIESSDVIILTDNPHIKSYIAIINKSKAENKIICMISSENTSDKIYTNDLNTHFSIYSPVLFASDAKSLSLHPFILEGFGIRYSEFLEFLSSKGISCRALSIEDVSFWINISLNIS